MSEPTLGECDIAKTVYAVVFEKEVLGLYRDYDPALAHAKRAGAKVELMDLILYARPETEFEVRTRAQVLESASDSATTHDPVTQDIAKK